MNLNRPVHQEQPDSPHRVTSSDERALARLQSSRAPSIRLLFGEWVGNLNPQSALFIGSAAHRRTRSRFNLPLNTDPIALSLGKRDKFRVGDYSRMTPFPDLRAFMGTRAFLVFTVDQF
jgi:hypothetical protein